jgi:hypothetical protein
VRRVLIDSDSREVESYSSRRRKSTPSDARRKEQRLAARALENRKAIEARRVEREESWSDGGRDEFLAYRQDADLAGLGQERRELRAAARASAAKGSPEPAAARVLGIAPGPVEGTEFRKGDPVRRLGA